MRFTIPISISLLIVFLAFFPNWGCGRNRDQFDFYFLLVEVTSEEFSIREISDGSLKSNTAERKNNTNDVQIIRDAAASLEKVDSIQIPDKVLLDVKIKLRDLIESEKENFFRKGEFLFMKAPKKIGGSDWYLFEFHDDSGNLTIIGTDPKFLQHIKAIVK